MPKKFAIAADTSSAAAASRPVVGAAAAALAALTVEPMFAMSLTAVVMNSGATSRFVIGVSSPVEGGGLGQIGRQRMTRPLTLSAFSRHRRAPGVRG
ncbi:MAG: hypothetical protein EKK34_09150 [Mycobacterium sp.]|nr:MAG: hypothetical protein EKK34_09150 [Mycobacterium sp.]